MLSANKPLVEFGKLDKCLSKYGKHFECDNDKEIIYSSDINSDDTFIILNGVISLRRGRMCWLVLHRHRLLWGFQMA